MAHEPLPPPPKRRRKQRWVRKLLIALAVLIVLAVAAVQGVLWSSLPRRIAENQVQEELGVAAKIESVSIGWLGTTHVQGVTLTMPMARSPLVQVRELTIHHDALPVMAFTKKVRSLAASGVKVDLRQDREGQWNLEHLLENLPEDPTPDPPDPVLDLPEFSATDVSVQMALNDGRTAELANVTLRGTRRPPLDYVLAADVGGDVHAEGRMALTRDATHHLTVALNRVPDALRPLLPKDLPDPLEAKLAWTGRRTEAGFEGSLNLGRLTAGKVQAVGEVELFTWDSKLVAAPKSLKVTLIEPAGTTRPTTAPAEQPFLFDDGRVVFGERIGLQRLRVRRDGGRLAFDGTIDHQTYSAELTAEWDRLTQAGLATAGRATIHIRRGLTGAVAAAIDAEGSVVAGDGKASGTLKVRGGGESLATLFADIETGDITWSSLDGKEFAVPALDISLRADGDDVRLTTLRPRDPTLGTLAAAGAYNHVNQTWYAALSARAVRLADLRVPGVHKPIDFDLDAFGTHTRLDVKEAYLRHGGAEYGLRGFYDSQVPDPVSFDTWARYKPPVRQMGATAGFPGLQFNGQVAGTLSPRKLKAHGSVTANDLYIRGERYVGDIDAEIEAEFTDDWMRLRSRDAIELLGGRWTLRGQWRRWSRNAADPLTIRLDWKDLPVANLGEVLKLGHVDGVIDKGTAELVIPSASLRDLKLTASASGSKLSIGQTGADSIDLKASIDRGDLAADVTLTSGQGKITSTITTSVLEPSPVTVRGELANWPAATVRQRERLLDLQAYLSGQFAAKYLPDSKAVNAEVKLNGRIERGDAAVGEFTLAGTSKNKVLTLDMLKLRTLDGKLDASGTADLADLNGANIDAAFEKLDVTQLAWLAPPLADLAGRYSGSLRIQPDKDPRALGPISITFHVTPDNGRFRTISVGDMKFSASATYNGAKDFRLVSTSGEMKLAEGTIKPFFRLTSTPAQGLTQLATLELEDLNLEPVVHAFTPKERKPVPGRVSGNIRLYGPVVGLAAVNGEASIRLTNSDLVNFGPVTFLYNLMRVGTAGTKPQGEGRLSFRVEQAILRVINAHYFNRGVEITAFGPIGQLDKIPDSPMKLILVGSARPLKNIKLPFFGDADEILSVLQGAVTTVEATGTLREPKSRQMALSEFSDNLKAIFLGIVKDENQQQ